MRAQVVLRPTTKKPRRNAGAEGTYAADAIGEEPAAPAQLE